MSSIPTPPQRPAFEKWLDEEMGLQSEWQEERNCFKDFAAHLAWKAWQKALSARSETAAIHQVLPLPPQPETITTSTHDPFFREFDCHFDGNIFRCDKDCKTKYGFCKRRSSEPMPSVPPSLEGKFPPRDSSPDKKDPLVAALESAKAFLATVDWNDHTSEEAAGNVEQEIEAALDAAPSTVGPSAGTIHSMTGECPTCGHSAHSSAIGVKYRQVGWAGLGTFNGELYIERVKRVDAGQAEWYPHAVYIQEPSASTDGEVAK